jgi:ABC-type lipoprotein export system ATPase subunit
MKIIVDLNTKEGITIIMVTHDTVLKGFATRTVRMLDGKIAKLEVF